MSVIIHANQYILSDNTILDFGNNDHQSCLTDYVEWQNKRAKKLVTQPNPHKELL